MKTNKHHIAQQGNNIISILQKKTGAQKGPGCSSATYKVNDKSSYMKLTKKMCIFLLPSCCSPKSNGFTVFFILRKLIQTL